MSMPYSITVLNNTELHGNFCVYQESQNPQEESLAWLVEKATPNVVTPFIWNLDYSFVQGEVGTLSPGVVFRPSQRIPANLDQQNTITLTEQNGFPMFTDLRSGIPNMLTIQPDQKIKPDRVAAGIGVYSSSMLVATAIANVNLSFRPQTKYRVAFGNFTKGEVLYTQGIANYAEIDFTSGVFNYNVTFNPDGTWTVQPA